MPDDPKWGADKPAEYGQYSDGITTETITTESGAYQAFYAAIAASILDGAPLPVPVQDARTIVEIIEAALQSAKEGRRIAL